MDKMWEEFEAWARISLKCDLSHNGEHYNHSNAYHAWLGWQASRKALVVELPTAWNASYTDKAIVMDASSVVEALEDAGVAYK